jgi:hypothetical protein
VVVEIVIIISGVIYKRIMRKNRLMGDLVINKMPAYLIFQTVNVKDQAVENGWGMAEIDVLFAKCLKEFLWKNVQKLNVLRVIDFNVDAVV